ncbi:ribosome assembly RNA-binding protein YhbY [Bacillaceae bacterium SIJ1]|uniref:ribosome assembly RNA-binding protein YhbY n=1 Tax=Litoribacterium kuwaitense TaxID=1398745 RepID=UPI0013EAA5F5|nr:ribosome assembly RNA-binding protein YhbY [Litoribacterium kuwaitense]NGP43485.1 ribosome assembly RNA-binding protein YhbY [Litoribacterium kuwaitense]
MNSLTNKQRRYLRSKAHHLQSIFQVGKQGVTDELAKQLCLALEARELIKMNVLNNAEVDAKEAAELLEEKTGAEVVQTIGNVIVLYKMSEKNPTIQLP